MKCPACSYVNPTMSARCIQCRTTLEHEGVGHSDLYKQGMRAGDTRILSMVGTVVGGALGFLAASMIGDVSPGEVLAYTNLRLIVVGSALAGAVIGRLVAWWKNRWL